MSLNTAKLKEAIKVLMMATSNRDLILQMAHLVFKEDEILAYNDRLLVVYPFKSGIECSIPAEDLNKALAGIDDKEINVTVTDDAVTFSSDSTEVVISTEIESRIVEDFFKTVDFGEMDWTEVPSNFLEKMALARFSASSNVLDANNTHCVKISGNTISSGDGYRLSIVEMSDEMDDVLIPATNVNDLINFDKFVDYAIDGGWIHFVTEDEVIVSSRIVLGDYPNFVPFFDNFEGQKEIELDTGMIPILQNIGALVEGESDFMKSVTIKIGRGETTIDGRKQGLTVLKKIKNSHGSDPIEFNVSPVFLAHILGITKTLSVGEDKALFQGPNFRHIVMLPISD